MMNTYKRRRNGWMNY